MRRNTSHFELSLIKTDHVTSVKILIGFSVIEGDFDSVPH